jgi:dolichol kinase
MSDELARRLVHASGATIPGVYLLDRYLFDAGVVTWRVVQAVCVAGLVLAGTLEAARLSGTIDHPIYDKLTREYEQDKVAGYALYVVSGTVVVLAFDPVVAVPALFMLTIGDPVSGILSTGELRTLKRPRVLVGMFAVSLAFAYPFMRAATGDPIVGVAAAVAGAAGATLADGVKPTIRDYVIDDNLTIPIVAAVAMQAVLFLGA